MRIKRCEQGSEEWFRLRLGRLTGTRFFTVAHSGPAVKNRLLETIEREIADPDAALAEIGERYSGGNLAFGHEHEPALLARYEILTGFTVERVGLVIDDKDDYLAASPDGLTADRVIEGKSRVSRPRHARTLLEGTFDPEYRSQIYGQIMVTGLDRADFVSFCPSWPAFREQVVIVQVPADSAYIGMLRRKCRIFWEMLQRGDRFEEGFDLADKVPNFFTSKKEDNQ